jgi:hypothetical protein
MRQAPPLGKPPHEADIAAIRKLRIKAQIRLRELIDKDTVVSANTA